MLFAYGINRFSHDVVHVKTFTCQDCPMIGGINSVLFYQSVIFCSQF